ncbi:MAG TPA: FKBP-type peptidyl-prolyl cis-trans isomerase [Saprospiraceae bacterium]|nr:FKBP-type peptidyl-prolyl cis-trans isomerase [Saprospiraceae bacterium]
MRQGILLFLSLAMFCHCAKDDSLSPEDQLKKDDGIIQDYLTVHKLTATKTASGLYYIITNPGSGSNPTVNNVVTVYYQGYFTDNTVFDQTVFGTPATFPLKSVIKGWQEGIPLIKKGGEVKLLIPSYLGYGNSPPGGIPENAVLIFDVQLLSF